MLTEVEGPPTKCLGYCKDPFVCRTHWKPRSPQSKLEGSTGVGALEKTVWKCKECLAEGVQPEKHRYVQNFIYFEDETGKYKTIGRPAAGTNKKQKTGKAGAVASTSADVEIASVISGLSGKRGSSGGDTLTINPSLPTVPVGASLPSEQIVSSPPPSNFLFMILSSDAALKNKVVESLNNLSPIKNVVSITKEDLMKFKPSGCDIKGSGTILYKLLQGKILSDSVFGTGPLFYLLDNIITSVEELDQFTQTGLRLGAAFNITNTPGDLMTEIHKRLGPSAVDILASSSVEMIAQSIMSQLIDLQKANVPAISSK